MSISFSEEISNHVESVSKAKDEDEHNDWFIISSSGSKRRNETIFDELRIGDGGRKNLETTLAEEYENKVAYGVLRFEAIDEKSGVISKRIKYILIVYIGSGVKIMEKASVSVVSPQVINILGSIIKTTIQIPDANLGKMSGSEISKLSLSIGASHKPVRFDFGGGEVIEVSDILLGENN